MVTALRDQVGGGAGVGGLPEDAYVPASLKVPDLGAHPYQVLFCCVLV